MGLSYFVINQNLDSEIPDSRYTTCFKNLLDPLIIVTPQIVTFPKIVTAFLPQHYK